MPTISKQVAIEKQYPIGTYFIQTILIPNSYTKQEAITWLKKNNLRHEYYRKTKHFHHFMQHNPIEGSRYLTKKLPNVIELVYQRFKIP